MKKIVKLTESQLTNMIKRVINEIESVKPSATPQKLAGGLCKDPYFTVTYNSSSGEPTYNCNSANGWGTDSAATAANGILTCKCFKGGRGGK
jgi:hypothetical protein